jgi:hypothetical protein
MKQLSKDGTTVLFVSHNLLAVADFCPRAIVMASGRVAFDGPVSEAITEYRRASISRDPQVSDDPSRVATLKVNGTSGTFVEMRPNDPLTAELTVRLPRSAPPTNAVLNLLIETPDGRAIVHLRSDRVGVELRLGPGQSGATVAVDELPLAPGMYWLWLRLVATDREAPLMWDSERVLLTVVGDQALDSVLLPRHRFGVSANQDPDTSGLDSQRPL